MVLVVPSFLSSQPPAGPAGRGRWPPFPGSDGGFFLLKGSFLFLLSPRARSDEVWIKEKFQRTLFVSLVL